MSHSADAQAWFAPSLLDPGIEQADNPREFERLWRGFMTARVTLGLVLLMLQSTIFGLGASKNTTLILICSGYFAAALTVRLMAKPRQLGRAFGSQWISTIGVDILAFAALQVAQGNSINYAPLFALPVLMASVLGTLLLAMGGGQCDPAAFFLCNLDVDSSPGGCNSALLASRADWRRLFRHFFFGQPNRQPIGQ